jgi:single-strand DNA-binding protein
VSGSLNKVCVLGNLGKDPVTKSFQNGGKVVNFSVACSESWKDRNTGEKKERTEWINVAVFSEGLATVCEKYLRKGSKVYIEGKLQTRKWQDQSGNDRYSTEVVLQGFDAKLLLLGDKPGSGGGGGSSGGNDWGGESNTGRSGSSSGGGFNGGKQQGFGGGGFADDLDDDVPF